MLMENVYVKILTTKRLLRVFFQNYLKHHKYRLYDFCIISCQPQMPAKYMQDRSHAMNYESKEQTSESGTIRATKRVCDLGKVKLLH